MTVLEVVVVAIWIMLPAYIPNNVAVVVGGGPPVDGGREFRGARLLGDGKTWRGTLGGIVAGVLLALGLNALASDVSGMLGLPVPTFSTLAILALPTGALVGDMAASFLKRRLGRERGAATPGVDQYDLVVGALAITAVVDWSWLVDVLSVWILLAIVLITPILHVSTNIIGYWLGFKEVPW